MAVAVIFICKVFTDIFIDTVFTIALSFEISFRPFAEQQEYGIMMLQNEINLYTV